MKITYLDICKENTDNLRQYCVQKDIQNINIINADIEKYNNLPENTFDLVFMCGIYQHIEPHLCASKNHKGS